MATKTSSKPSLSEKLKTEELDLAQRRLEVINAFEKVSVEKMSITIASWNVKNATQKKEMKLQIIANVINEISPDVIALQEIASPGALALYKILDQLGPTWEATFNHEKGSTSCLAFLWNNEKIKPGRTRGGGLTHRGYCRAFYYKTFEAVKGTFNFKLVNFHLRPLGVKEHVTEIDNLHEVYERVNEKKYSVIFIGDFNEYPCNDHLKKLMYENVIRPDQRTNVLGSKCFDNMIVPYSLYLCCDEHKVKKNFETTCFDHYPIFAKFSTPMHV